MPDKALSITSLFQHVLLQVLLPQVEAEVAVTSKITPGDVPCPPMDLKRSDCEGTVSAVCDSAVNMHAYRRHGVDAPS